LLSFKNIPHQNHCKTRYVEKEGKKASEEDRGEEKNKPTYQTGGWREVH
jgi:hypothetical protein